MINLKLLVSCKLLYYPVPGVIHPGDDDQFSDILIMSRQNLLLCLEFRIFSIVTSAIMNALQRTGHNKFIISVESCILTFSGVVTRSETLEGAKQDGKSSTTLYFEEFVIFEGLQRAP